MKNVNVPVMVIGLVIALAASVLLVMDVIDSGPAALIGIIGIGLIAASGRKKGQQGQ